jgi:hypothetical protein
MKANAGPRPVAYGRSVGTRLASGQRRCTAELKLEIERRFSIWAMNAMDFGNLVINYFPSSPMELHHENEAAVNFDRRDLCCVPSLCCKLLCRSKYKNTQMYGCTPKAVGNE